MKAMNTVKIIRVVISEYFHNNDRFRFQKRGSGSKLLGRVRLTLFRNKNTWSDD